MENQSRHESSTSNRRIKESVMIFFKTLFNPDQSGDLRDSLLTLSVNGIENGRKKAEELVKDIHRTF